MRDLCLQLKDELVLIAYELAPELVAGGTFGNLRIGQSSDFASNFVSKLLGGDDSNLITSRIETVTRVAKSRYKLHYKGDWELEIFITSTKRLLEIRSFLLSQELGLPYNGSSLHSRRKILVTETVTLDTPTILHEEDDQVAVEMDQKPELNFKYKPVVNLGECIDIYILHRPKRQRHSHRS
ncbi:hypothetical protein HG537_0F04450 [Torulaspora globosa]|uniref:Uncharacterized protein n=1 Tax=Torulaspora globosa TaxID=48254 RepID=A0A7H9HVC6_9SACH|nr:hypothetical protein HG537_0F04450 [Torulaspora sp. CBS 2947]